MLPKTLFKALNLPLDFLFMLPKRSSKLVSNELRLRIVFRNYYFVFMLYQFLQAHFR